uniref:DUF1640 domain-containing protein n=1 Tax=Candidatus Kentrum sp. DK TaxID=2126562 RepID=A0A450T1Z3_9GAMM|nr:MAG: hypothetical protein BECKDK2373C_GA0170839_10822 [Candidatus Kentron sp. DK]
MTAITFDTLKFTKRLTDADANPELAEATAGAFRDAHEEMGLATREDIDKLKSELKSEMELLRIHTDTGLKSLQDKTDSIRWMLLIPTIAVIAPQLKGFFG